MKLTGIFKISSSLMTAADDDKPTAVSNNSKLFLGASTPAWIDTEPSQHNNIYIYNIYIKH